MEEKLAENDVTLVEACVNKDLTAWARFVNKYSGLINGSIVNRLKKYGFTLAAEDIEDIRQNILSSIWKGNKLGAIRNTEDVSYWLSIVSGNAALDYLRKKRHSDPVNKIPLYDSLSETELLDYIPSATPDPGQTLIRNEISERIESAIDLLPPNEKIVIKLSLVHGKKYHEISKILNIPQGSVSTWADRAKEKLKKYLKELK